MIVAIFYEHSLFQIISLNLLEWLFIGVTLKTKPFDTVYSTINFIVVEILISIVFFCCLIIKAYDYNHVLKIEERVNLGWAVIYCNFTFRLWVLILGFGKIILESIADIMENKKNKHKNK